MKLYAIIFLMLFGGLQAQNTVNVTFNFDATPLITNCWIEPANGGKLALSGSMNGWNNTGEDALTKGSGNNYAITKTLGKKSVGDTTFHYKLTAFATNTSLIAWEADPNRSFVLSPSATHQTINIGAWQGAISNICVPTANVEINFKVNVTAYRLAGEFVAATDVVAVAGDFNSWNNGVAGADTLKATAVVDEFSKKKRFQNHKLGVPQLKFKFIMRKAGATEPAWEGGDDRQVIVPVGITDANQDGWLDYAYEGGCFNGLCLDDVFPEPQTCYLELDARPAFYRLLDVGNLPTNVQTGTAGITQINGFFVNGPLSLQPQSASTWTTFWGDGLGQLGQSDAHRLKDDGLNGDLVAGDSVYTKKFDFGKGNLRQYSGKFSANGFDNEAGANANDIVKYPIGACRVRTVFGVFGPFANGKLSDDPILCGSPLPITSSPYDNYILISHSVIPGATNPPYYQSNVVVVRRGGDVDGTKCPAIEQVSSEIPKETALLSAYPNPFTDKVNFKFELKSSERVNLKVYDATGKQVAVLLDNVVKEAGVYQVDFTAQDWANGVYFYRLETPTQQLSRSVVLIR